MLKDRKPDFGWLAGHRLQASRCHVRPTSIVFVNVRSWKEEAARGELTGVMGGFQNSKQLTGFLHSLLLYVYVMKWFTVLVCVIRKANMGASGECGSRPRDFTEWGILLRANTTNSLLKTILLKRELSKGWAVVYACKYRHTHTPLSWSHYKLTFQPVIHPSVQMVRKAAPSLSPSLLHTPSFGWKKIKDYASNRLQPNGGGMQIGCQVGLTARGAAKD